MGPFVRCSLNWEEGFSYEERRIEEDMTLLTSLTHWHTLTSLRRSKYDGRLEDWVDQSRNNLLI